jgi:hypothetical protein
LYKSVIGMIDTKHPAWALQTVSASYIFPLSAQEEGKTDPGWGHEA